MEQICACFGCLIFFVFQPPAGFFKVTDIDATELARQLCLIESRLFQAIKPKEYLGENF